MNRMFSTFLMVVLAASVGLAASNVVTSVNTVGYKTVALPPGGDFIMLSLNFDAFDQTFLGVFGTDQLTQATKAGGADNIFVWNASTASYSKFWQQPGGVFQPSNTSFVAGEAIWIKSPDASTTTNMITLAGEAVDVAAQSVDIVTGFNMIGFPFSADEQLADTTFAADGATAATKAGGADNVYLWDAAAQSYSKTFLQPAGWTVDAPLPMAEGFWYEARNDFTWSQTNTYSGNL